MQQASTSRFTGAFLRDAGRDHAWRARWAPTRWACPPVPEVIAARHMGIRVLGISCITNMAAGVLKTKLDHRRGARGGREGQGGPDRRPGPDHRGRRRSSREEAARQSRPGPPAVADRAGRARARTPRARALSRNSRSAPRCARATGEIVTGCNVENASYGLTHVRRARGGLQGRLGRDAASSTPSRWSPDSPRAAPPCGPCRQILWEFCGDIWVHMVNLAGPLDARVRPVGAAADALRRKEPVSASARSPLRPTGCSPEPQPAQPRARRAPSAWWRCCSTKPPRARRGRPRAPADRARRASRRGGPRSRRRRRVLISAGTSPDAWPCSGGRVPIPSARTRARPRRVMAGGKSVFFARGEDRDDIGRAGGGRLGPGDLLVGISARAPSRHVRARSPPRAHARSVSWTVLVTCAPGRELAPARRRVVISGQSGPEVLTEQPASRPARPPRRC